MTGPPSQMLTINGVEIDLAGEVLRDRHGVAVPFGARRSPCCATCSAIPAASSPRTS